MARFRIAKGKDEVQLGGDVLQIAEEVGATGASLTRVQRESYTNRIAAYVDQTDGKLEVVLAFDTPDTVHVIVPFLDGAVYSANNFAAEAMGFVTIRGCGR